MITVWLWVVFNRFVPGMLALDFSVFPVKLVAKPERRADSDRSTARTGQVQRSRSH
jgi:hypothetical protein